MAAGLSLAGLAFATWLEDAGVPGRVIDELMGHEATGRSRQLQGSAMGAHYRHTTRRRWLPASQKPFRND